MCLRNYAFDVAVPYDDSAVVEPSVVTDRGSYAFSLVVSGVEVIGL